MQTDRFVNTGRRPPTVRFLPELAPAIDQDTQVNQMYRMLVMNQTLPEPPEGEVKPASCRSMHSIKSEDDLGYGYLGKLGLDLKRLALGPTVVTKPDRVLEALTLSDNFYLNLLDCSSGYVLAVGLSRGIYLWRPCGSIARIREQSPDVTSLQWSRTNAHLLACGNRGGGVEIWDAERGVCLQEWAHHEGRVGTVEWMSQPNCLLSGGKDACINQLDMRVNRRAARYKFHSQEICSVRAQGNSRCLLTGSETFASGSNDRNLVVWSTSMRSPVQVYKHKAAIRGISWHPSKSGILASGGGSEDKTIKIWNTNTSEMLKCIDTGSQVCNLRYINEGANLISTHGYNKFQVNIWDSTSLAKQQVFLGHKKRVLYLAVEPDDQRIITGAGDQSIRFWKTQRKDEGPVESEYSHTQMQIR